MDQHLPASVAELRSRLERNPIIPGVKSLVDVKMAVAQEAPLLFFLTGSIFNLRDAANCCQAKGTWLFAHVDLLTGIGKDAEGMRFLAREIGVTGILTTRSVLIKAAAKEGLLTVQRVFAVDSDALKTGLELVRSSVPHALEILPALVLPSIAHRLPFAELPPVIAGGLLETQEEVKAVLRTPAVAVSASRPSVWRRLRTHRRPDGPE